VRGPPLALAEILLIHIITRSFSPSTASSLLLLLHPSCFNQDQYMPRPTTLYIPQSSLLSHILALSENLNTQTVQCSRMSISRVLVGWRKYWDRVGAVTRESLVRAVCVHCPDALQKAAVRT
jgi:hypothetical protein